MGDVEISEPVAGQMASLAAAQGQQAPLSAAVRAHWGVALPVTPRFVASGGMAFLWAGPDRWMVTSDAAEDLESLLCRKLGAWAAVTDQSDSRRVLRVAGRRARESLTKLIGIDLHPRAFRPGDTALTTGAGIALQIWQRDDAPSFELVAFRSYGDHLAAALAAAAAEFGAEARR